MSKAFEKSSITTSIPYSVFFSLVRVVSKSWVSVEWLAVNPRLVSLIILQWSAWHQKGESRMCPNS